MLVAVVYIHNSNTVISESYRRTNGGLVKEKTFQPLALVVTDVLDVVIGG